MGVLLVVCVSVCMCYSCCVGLCVGGCVCMVVCVVGLGVVWVIGYVCVGVFGGCGVVGVVWMFIVFRLVFFCLCMFVYCLFVCWLCGLLCFCFLGCFVGV